MRIDRCPHCKQRLRRSSDQNRRLWALYHLMSEKIQPGGKVYSADQWHLYFKTKFLGAQDVRLPSGKVLTLPNSTADMDVPAFSEYLTQVEAFCNERGVYLEDATWAA